MACLTIVPGQADFLGTIYAFGAMLSFTIAHAAVVALRVSQPDAERPSGRATCTVRGAVTARCCRSLAAVGTGVAFVVVRARTSDAGLGHDLAGVG